MLEEASALQFIRGEPARPLCQNQRYVPGQQAKASEGS